VLAPKITPCISTATNTKTLLCKDNLTNKTLTAIYLMAYDQARLAEAIPFKTIGLFP
jgi:hypothetical protein